MDIKQQVEDLISLPIQNDEKIKKLNDLILDCYNEMEAQDQNMHPEVHHNLAAGLQLAKDKLRELTR